MESKALSPISCFIKCRTIYSIDGSLFLKAGFQKAEVLHCQRMLCYNACILLAFVPLSLLSGTPSTLRHAWQVCRHCSAVLCTKTCQQKHYFISIMDVMEMIECSEWRKGYGCALCPATKGASFSWESIDAGPRPAGSAAPPPPDPELQ